MNRDFNESFKYDGRIDKANLRINGIAVLCSTSRNNHYYTQEALKSSLPLVNNCKSFLDHSYSPEGHSVMNLLGVFSNPRLDKNTVRADLQLFKSSKGCNLLLDLASNHSSAIGFSINAKGAFRDTCDSEGRDVCERILQLRSIDAVSFPASTQSLWESDEVSQLRARNKELFNQNIKLRERIKSSPASISSISRNQGSVIAPDETLKRIFWQELKDNL